MPLYTFGFFCLSRLFNYDIHIILIILYINEIKDKLLNKKMERHIRSSM